MFGRAVVTADIGRRDFAKKKEAKKEKEIKARWAQDKSFSKIKVDVFPQTSLSLMSCFPLNLQVILIYFSVKL